MASWKDSARDGALAGSLASVLSALALVACGQRREGEPAAPLNAVSHWVWGDKALAKDAATMRHTALGYFIHHTASLFWSTLHVRAWGSRDEVSRAPEVIARAAVTTAAAAFVDFKLTPHRFTPGFEHRLTRPQLTAVYVCFAVGLALGGVVSAHARAARVRR